MTEFEITAVSGRSLHLTPLLLSRCDAPAQSGVNPIPLQNACGLSCDVPQPAWVVLANRIAELESQVAYLERENADACAKAAAWEAERDDALLRMEVAIATSHAWIDAEVRRRKADAAANAADDQAPHRWSEEATCHALRAMAGLPAEVYPPARPAFPANALRHKRQAIGLLSTADAGRVRLGGYAPSLPPR